jgi:Xaa-Pro aminopeptidase
MAESDRDDRRDEPLNDLLSRAGSRFDAAGVRDLLPGVLAAPEGGESEAWMTLTAESPSEALRAALLALRADCARSAHGEADHAARLAALRAELARRGLDGFAVPHADEHQGEYLPLRAERLAWLTGFTGSAGMALVLAERAAVFADGRYTLQVQSQVDGALFTHRHLTEQPPAAWIEAHLPSGAKLGYDPWLHTERQVAGLGAAAAKAGGELVACSDNPLDAVWADQPPPPIAPIVAHSLEFAGRTSAEKRGEAAEALRKAGAEAAVLTLPDSVAWLLNVRGGDVARTPLALCFAVLHGDATLEWFVDRRKLVPGLEAHLGNGVSLRAPGELGAALDALGRAGKRVLADPASAAAWVFQRLREAGAEPVEGADPCQLPKARKNEAELTGTRRAHRRDGASLVRFLAWLAAEAPARAEGGDPEGGLGEIEAAERLLEFRRGNENFRDLSFDTISAAGPNAALPHYRVTPESERRLGPGELYLVDSGGQYLDGTTDVTRTLAVGAAAAEMRERFTRVLKGHIAIATARFPKGTTGSQLDTLARVALWRAGLDFDHGTGHGVGSYLGVHEGPQRISKVPNTVALEPGMIVSNEPGYYKEGAYGIRIENLVAVVEDARPPGDERPMLAFETLTLAPIDLALVEPGLLTAEETAWLDAYHARVRAALTPLVDEATAEWLVAATRPLGTG